MTIIAGNYNGIKRNLRIADVEGLVLTFSLNSSIISDDQLKGEKTIGAAIFAVEDFYFVDEQSLDKIKSDPWGLLK